MASKLHQIPPVGHRVRLRDPTDPNVTAAGFVRYSGPLASAHQDQQGRKKQWWIGIEWDDVERGKHDGCAFGERYFSTRNSLASGTFVKLNKFLERMENLPRRSISEAIHVRYLAEASVEEMTIGGRGRVVRVELVGEEKVRQRLAELDMATKMTLQEMGIWCSSDDLGSMCPNLLEIDLSDNLFHDWSSVVDICKQLPKLRSLLLSGNHFSEFRNNVETFDHVKVLVLNHTKLNWQQIEHIKDHFPTLEEMHLVGNDIKNLPLREDDVEERGTSWVERWSTLRVMELSHNAISDWGEICKLAQLPQLQRLHLNDNHLGFVSYPSGGLDDAFNSLQVLLLGNNAIDGWESVNELNRFPALQEVRLDGNPLTQQHIQSHEQQISNLETDSMAKTIRMSIIAKISQLAILNGSNINFMERRDCEIYYLKKCGQEKIDNTRTTKQEFEQQHPRYVQLAERFGDPTEVLQRSNSGQSRKNRVIHITIVNQSPTSRSSKTQVTKKLLPTTSVLQVKQICQRAFKLEVKKQLLRTGIVDANEHRRGVERLELLDDDSRDISYYGIADGSVVYMDEVNREKELNDAAIRDREHMERVAQQERDASRRIQWQRDQFATSK